MKHFRFHNSAKVTFLRLHKLALQLGVIVLPNHYYTGVADLGDLARTRKYWARKSAMVGVEWLIEQQVKSLKTICTPFEPEYRGNRTYIEASRSDSGPGYGYVEAQALHAVMRHFKPRQVVEVGSGVSTRCILAAAAMNYAEDEQDCEIACIEPHPRSWLRDAPVQLIERPVQTVDAHFFERLGERSLLFIDSSHAVHTGSDVNYLILEVLPRLRHGVVVHFHDIYLPYDYPRDALDTFSQAQETALLHAFLIGNRSVNLLFSLSQLHYERTADLQLVFPEYRPQFGRDGLRDDSLLGQDQAHFPSSLYLEVRSSPGLITHILRCSMTDSMSY
jgi:hypothetical protein